MTFREDPQWSQAIATYPRRNNVRTETTVVEEETYDTDGKLISKTKTTTTRTWTEPDYFDYPRVTY